MNWLFGKKKPSVDVYVAEEMPEGFSSVATRPYESPLPPYPVLPRLDNPAPYPPPYPPTMNPYPASSPYPPAPYPKTYPYQAPTKSTDTGANNPLDSVPFVLAKSLAINRNTFGMELEPIRQQLNQIRSRIDTYSYDFSLEESVINEHNNKIMSYR